MDRQAWFLVGPTASGKTEVAHALARQLGAWILSADSMTVYRGLDVGTAKPTARQREEIRYFGLDLVNPDAAFSVADFLTAAREAFDCALRESHPLIVVGGSGLYIRCLLEGLREGAPAQPALRAEAETLLAQGGVVALQARVRDAAPSHFAALADPGNPRRLVRAWELAMAGQPPAPTWTGPRPRLTGLGGMAAERNARIALRVMSMFERGLLEETRALRVHFPVWSATASQAIGYAEALTHLRGACTLAQAMERTQQRTRQLARRQVTWFRHQADVDWIDAAADASLDAQAAAVHASWKAHGPTHAHI